MPQVEAKNLSDLMWVEKYRPTKLDDVVNQKEIVESLKNLMKEPAEMPHLLFTGPAGALQISSPSNCLDRHNPVVVFPTPAGPVNNKCGISAGSFIRFFNSLRFLFD